MDVKVVNLETDLACKYVLFCFDVLKGLGSMFPNSVLKDLIRSSPHRP